MPRTIHWRYANDGTGQPGPAVPAIGSETEIVVKNVTGSTPIEINYSADPAAGTWVPLTTLATTVPADRVPLITTAPGSRLKSTAATYYFDGQNEMADPLTHPMIMGFTHTAIKDGFWNDSTVWDAGTVPGTGAIVSTGNFYVKYRGESDAILDSVFVPMGGKLSWDPFADTRMRLYFGMSMGIVEQDDPAESATLGKRKHEIIFHGIRAPGASTELGWLFMGPSRHRGAQKKGRLKLGLTPAQVTAGDTAPSVLAGSDVIYLPGLAASGWRVQDDIVVGATEYIEPVATDPDYTGPTSYWGFQQNTMKQIAMNAYQFSQNEQRKIITISGDYATLDSPLTYNHTGITRTLKDGKVVTIEPVVANPCRNFCFRSASFEQDGTIDSSADLRVLQKRAHLMWMRIDSPDIRHIETQNMSRTDTNPTLNTPEVFPYQVDMAGGVGTISPILDVTGGVPLADPNNVRGRYGMHLHFCDGLSNVVGVSAWAPDWAPPIPGWAITQHGTHANLDDCVTINFRGAGIVTELGSETGQWIDCTSMGGRGDGEDVTWGNRNEVYTNHNDSAGIAFANQSRAIIMHGCISVGCHHSYLWHAQKTNRAKRSPRDVDLRLMDGMTKGYDVLPAAVLYLNEGYGMIDVQIPPFLDNQAHASRFGIHVIHRAGDARKLDKTPMIIKDFNCLGVPSPFNVPQYSNSYYGKDCLWVGPVTAAGAAINLGNVTWDWNFSNIHVVNYARVVNDSGAGLNYEGNFIDITMENVAQFWNAPYRAARGDHSSRDVMGPWIVHPDDTAKLDTDATKRWIIREYINLDSATDLPTPYPLAPYGAKLPANDPGGTPYPAVPYGATPYFTIGDGINGAASTGINLTLTAGGGRGKGSLHGILRDSVGDRRWPDWQTSETFPSNISIKGPRTFGKLQPEQVVERHGCWLDGAVWKVRTPFFGADRASLVQFSFFVDWTVEGLPADFLAAHDIGVPVTTFEWPNKAEVTIKAQKPLFPRAKAMQFLSRTRLEVVEGVTLTHRLRPNAVSTKLSIVGGADAAQFQVSNQQLQWTAAGTRTRNGADANADNTYEVIVRTEDVWDNFREDPHQVIVVPSARVVASLDDRFVRPDALLTANPAYLMLSGVPETFSVVSNRLSVAATAASEYISLADLGTSQQKLDLAFTGFCNALVTMRMADIDNWLAFRRNDGVGAAQLFMSLGGVVTELCRFVNVSSQITTITLDGDVISLTKRVSDNHEIVPMYPTSPALQIITKDPLAGPGTMLLPANAPRGTQVGVRSSNSGNANWMSRFIATALPS